MSPPDEPGDDLSRQGRYLILVTVFLGWMFAGVVMNLIPVAGRAATRSLGVSDEAHIGQWFAWYICVFLLGAAAGGLLFGWLGDRIGRSKAMGLSILWYSALTGLTYLVQNPAQLLVLRFLACLGIGGMWPNGVSLVSEAWAGVSRPLLAGLIGTAANVGFVIFGVVGVVAHITAESWRWVWLVGAAPVLLGLFVLAFVPESPRWLATKASNPPPAASAPPPLAAARSPVAEIFRPPLLTRTLIGIALGMIPLLGNWGGANWLIPWAGQVGGDADPSLKAWTSIVRSGGGVLGSLIGGWVASFLGRRTTYFLISLCSLLISLFIFWFIDPRHPHFFFWTFAIGFFGILFFGWLPLYLPELFPTRVRATGSGVSFNFGRIVTAVGVLGAGQLMAYFGEYASVGRVTCLIYVLGMIVICFAPDTSRSQLED